MSTDTVRPAAAVAGCTGPGDTDELTAAVRGVARFVGAVVDVYTAYGIPLPDLGGDHDA